MPGRAKADLSRRAIVESALTIADTEGLEAVTIRRVAQEFGVTPMALYWYVQNKDELLAAMGQSFFDGIGRRYARTGRWDEQLRGVVQALIESLREHPASAMLTFGQVLACEEGLEIAEFALDVLRTADFDVVEAAEVSRRALQVAIMLVTQQAGEELEIPADQREAAVAAKGAALRQLPIDRFPRLVEAADALIDCDDVEGYYASGVDMFISGVRARHRHR
jgi:AcrR family transcriptional regulator